MAGKRIQDWLNTAVSGIRFKPDRAAVEEELRGHFEDKVADLQRFYHISQEEAEEMALGQMGNAEEIGKEMAKIHKPWLGYLWMLSKGMIVLSIVGLIGVALLWGDDAFLGDDPASELWDFDALPHPFYHWMYFGERGNGRSPEEIYLSGDDRDQITAKKLNETDWVNGQRIAAKYAAVWRDGDMRSLWIYLRLETLLFWERGSLRMNWMKITDSLGNVYPLGYGSDAVNQMGGGGYGPFHYGVEIVLGELDPEAEWIRLEYGPDGTMFSLLVELEREEEV